MQQEEKKNKIARRFVELDVLRGFAILLMSLYHLVFDLVAYFDVPLNLYPDGIWWYVGRGSALLFMLISGMSSTLGKSSFKRGAIVLGCGLIVTLFSLPVMGENYVRFGILHFFGAAMILKALFEKIVKSPKVRFAVAVILIPLSWWLGKVTESTLIKGPWLLPIGIAYPGFTSFDYYPLFPWLGVFAAGVVLGMLVYKNKRALLVLDITQKQESAPREVARQGLRPLAFLGRHSLLVYLVHQPLILGALYLIHFAGLL